MSKILIACAVAVAACTRTAPVVQAGTPKVADRPSAAPVASVGFWSDTIRPLATLSRGWNRIPGRFGSGCAFDSTYAFKVRPGLPDKVLIYLNGGGACWRGADCDPKHAAYTTSADSPSNDVSARVGVFDYNNEKNPLREYTMIFVSYCTADMHLGTREVDYDLLDAKTGRSTNREFAVRHGGAANVEAVEDWVFANLKSPRTVIVAGTNAGAVASPVIATRMAHHYPRARVVQLGEGAGAYQGTATPEIFSGWGLTEYLQRDAAYRRVDSADFNFLTLYTAAGRATPRVHFAQLNVADDASQAAFLTTLGMKSASIHRGLAANLDTLREVLPWFRSFIVPGTGGALLRSNLLYSTSVDGVALVDWLGRLIDYAEVDNVGSALLDPSKELPKPKARPKSKPKAPTRRG